MMNAVYNTLARRGIHLEVHGETLRAHFRGRALPNEVRRLIRQNKTVLLDLLRRKDHSAGSLIICRDATGTPIRAHDRVQCRDGAPAVVLQRFRHRVAVYVKGESCVRFCEPWDITVRRAGPVNPDLMPVTMSEQDNI